MLHILICLEQCEKTPESLQYTILLHDLNDWFAAAVHRVKRGREMAGKARR